MAVERDETVDPSAYDVRRLVPAFPLTVLADAFDYSLPLHVNDADLATARGHVKRLLELHVHTDVWRDCGATLERLILLRVPLDQLVDEFDLKTVVDDFGLTAEHMRVFGWSPLSLANRVRYPVVFLPPSMNATFMMREFAFSYKTLVEKVRLCHAEFWLLGFRAHHLKLLGATFDEIMWAVDHDSSMAFFGDPETAQATWMHAMGLLTANHFEAYQKSSTERASRLTLYRDKVLA